MSAFIPNHVPSFLAYLYNAGYTAYTGRSYDGGEVGSKQKVTTFIVQGLRTAIAGAICLAAYKGSTTAVIALSTISLPATTVAWGALVLAKGCTALKAVIVAKQFLQIPVAIAALYSGWLTLDKCYIKPFLGAGLAEFRDQSQKGSQSLLQGLSGAIAQKLGY